MNDLASEMHIRVIVGMNNTDHYKIVYDGTDATEAAVQVGLHAVTMTQVGLEEKETEKLANGTRRTFEGTHNTSKNYVSLYIKLEVFIPNELQIINAELAYLNMLKRCNKS